MHRARARIMSSTVFRYCCSAWMTARCNNETANGRALRVFPSVVKLVRSVLCFLSVIGEPIAPVRAQADKTRRSLSRTLLESELRELADCRSYATRGNLRLIKSNLESSLARQYLHRVQKSARSLDISPSRLRCAIRIGKIEHPFPSSS